MLIHAFITAALHVQFDKSSKVGREGTIGSTMHDSKMIIKNFKNYQAD